MQPERIDDLTRRPSRWRILVRGSGGRRVRRLLALAALVGAGIVAWLTLRPPPLPANVVLVVDLDGEDDPDARDVLLLARRLELAACDSRVVGVILRVGRAAGGPGHVEELRALVAELRQRGKPIFAFASAPDTLGYLLASAAGEIWLDRGTRLHLGGLRLETSFLGPQLRERGLEADLVPVGPLDPFFEQMTAGEPSSALDADLRQLASALHEETVSTISRARALESDRVLALFDDPMIRPARALELRLVDRVGHYGELLDEITERLGADVTFVPVDRIDGEAAPESSIRVALIHVRGILVDTTSAGVGLGLVASADDVVEALDRAERDSSVDAIIVRFESAGGSHSAVRRIHARMRRVATSKTLLASLGDTAGAGAYAAASAAHETVCQPSTITGGLGLTGGKIISRVLEERSELAGPSRRVYSVAPRAGMLGAHAPLDPVERRALARCLDEERAELIAQIALARRLPRPRVEETAQGRLYCGREALERGWVDSTGGLPTAFRRVRELLGTSLDASIDLVRFPQAPTPIERWHAWREASAAPRAQTAPRTRTTRLESPGVEVNTPPDLERLLDGRRHWLLLPLGWRVR